MSSGRDVTTSPRRYTPRSSARCQCSISGLPPQSSLPRIDRASRAPLKVSSINRQPQAKRATGHREPFSSELLQHDQSAKRRCPAPSLNRLRGTSLWAANSGRLFQDLHWKCSYPVVLYRKGYENWRDIGKLAHLFINKSCDAKKTQ